MFRIGFSGTNWTGKTETIQRIVREHSELVINTISLSSLVNECPFPMIEEQTVEASKWMIEQVGAICSNNNGAIEIFDRTPLDILAFTLYAMDRTDVHNQVVLEDCLALAVAHRKEIDVNHLIDHFNELISYDVLQDRIKLNIDIFVDMLKERRII